MVQRRKSSGAQVLLCARFGRPSVASPGTTENNTPGTAVAAAAAAAHNISILCQEKGRPETTHRPNIGRTAAAVNNNISLMRQDKRRTTTGTK